MNSYFFFYAQHTAFSPNSGRLKLNDKKLAEMTNLLNRGVDQSADIFVRIDIILLILLKTNKK